jgi:hypothetical protein
MRALFVVKAVDRAGNVAWLTAPESRGFRCVSVITDADTFATPDEAQDAIARMPAAFVKAGVQFSIESQSPFVGRAARI